MVIMGNCRSAGGRGFGKFHCRIQLTARPFSAAKLARSVKFDKRTRRRNLLSKRDQTNGSNMAEIDDDPVASWKDRVASLRKRGRVSGAALAVVRAEETDVRRGRPPAPERLSKTERELWERLTFSRRPGWFLGAETLLESFVITTIQCQEIETALRKAKPVPGPQYQKLARLHRATVALAATLATRLRLTPHSKIHKTQPTDGDLPVG